MLKQKTLVILRHAKSTWDYFNVTDIDRPLNEKGINNAILMANRLNMLNIKPGIIFSSPANRAIHTALIVARILNLSSQNVIIKEDIYMSDMYDVIEIIKKINNTHDIALLVGHNPACTELANYYSNLNIDNIPTMGAISLKFSTDKWKEISRNNTVFSNFDFPKNK